jgi:hypothetical protein
MPTITRYLVFANPPKDLYQTQEQAEEAAKKKAQADQGTTYQVWELTGDRVSTVLADVVVTVTPEP